MDKEYGKTKGSAETEKLRKGDTLDYYNEDLPLKAVGKLFEEKAAPVKDTKRVDEEDVEYEFLNKEMERDLKKVHDRYASRTAPAQREQKPSRPSAEKKTAAMYDNEYEDDADDSETPSLKIIIPVISCIFLVVLLFLIYKVNSATNKLKQAEESASNYALLNQDYQALKIENEALQTQVASLQAQLASNIGTEPVQSDDSQSTAATQAPATNQNASDESSQNSEYTLYTVVQGDSLSKISQKFYGTQGQYQKIKDYNGMTNDNVAIGQVLKIPK